MGDCDNVSRLQELLVSMGTLCAQCTASTNMLLAALDGKDQTSAYVERLVSKTEKPLEQLVKLDREFRQLLRQTLSSASGSAKSFKAKKLKTDYERKLSVESCIAKGNNALKKSRYVLVSLKKKEHTIATSSSSNPFADRKEAPKPPNQQFTLIQEYDDKRTQEEETEQLRSIAKNCLLVEEMATEVGSILEVQQDDISRLEGNTDESVERAIEGVHELSAYKKKQASSGATKATLGTATIGGLIGIVGGPVGIALGAAAGGVVGAVAGKGVSAVKRSSINAETRRIKTLLAVKERKSGEFVLQVYAYEFQQWSYLQRTWVHFENYWRDEFGEPLAGPHPENDMSAPEARISVLAMARSNLADEDIDEILKLHEREVKLNVKWRWVQSKWRQVMERKNTDLAGWDFAKSAKSGAENWSPEASRGCVVRRRLWVRSLEGKPSVQQDKLLRVNDVRLKLQETAGKTDGKEVQTDLWEGIYSSTTTTNAIMNESLLRVQAQGGQIGNAERNATVVGDVAVYSERIDRASNLTGAIRNMMTWPTGTKLSETEQFAKELEKRRQLAQDEFDSQSKKASSNGDVVSETSRNIEENLRIASRMANELDIQNEQLDRTADAVERGNQGMLKMTKRIK